jgi:putative SOS response-associated peptidase YedK
MSESPNALNGKQPFYIHPDNGEYLPFAGLYDIWKNPEGIEIPSFTIITTQPTVNLKAIHNRMPVILEPDAEDVWLDPEVTDTAVLTSILHPYTIRPLVRDHRVTTRGRRRSWRLASLAPLAFSSGAGLLSPV